MNQKGGNASADSDSDGSILMENWRKCDVQVRNVNFTGAPGGNQGVVIPDDPNR